MAGRDIAEWMDAGVNVIYFVFCDPVRPAGLLATGLVGQAAVDVLLKRVPVTQYAHRPDRLR